MYLTPDDIREARFNTVQLVSAVSNTCLDASGRLVRLFFANTRQALTWSGEHFTKVNQDWGNSDVLAALQPAAPYPNASCTYEEFYEAVDGIYKALVQAAEMQVRICDQLLFHLIEQGARTSPWEGEIALNTLRATVESAEAVLHGMTDAAIRTAEIAEEQVRHMAEDATPEQPVKKTASRKRSAVKQE